VDCASCDPAIPILRGKGSIDHKTIGRLGRHRGKCIKRGVTDIVERSRHPLTLHTFVLAAMAAYTLLAATLLGLVAAQTPGTTPEVHPKLTTWKCTKAGGCTSKNTAVVIDSATHWIHQRNNTALGCGNWGGAADPAACPDEKTCAQNCIMEGISDYKDYGVSTEGGKMQLDMYNPTGGVASPRLYLLAEDEKNYEMLQLTGNELSFDVDVSKLPCGMNGALYLSEMKADGGRSELNPGGAAYGTGYCKLGHEMSLMMIV
jgi:cellulase